MKFFREHFLAVCFAIFVGALAVLPSILAPLAIGADYKGVQFLYLDDEDIYRARIHEILDGYPMVAAPMLYEYKNDPVIMPPVNEYFYALPAFLFGLSFVMVASKFLFPVILFLLVYFLVKKMIGEEKSKAVEWTALAAGFLVVLGSDIVDYNTLIPWLRGMRPTDHLLVWTRPVNPIIGALMVFSFLLLLWNILTRKHPYAYIFAGILLGSMIGYFFTLGISLCILAALGGICLLRKEYGIVKELGYVVIISMIIDASYWYHTLGAVGGSDGRAFAERNGMYFTHAPVLNKVLFAATFFALVSFAYAYFVQKSRESIRAHAHAWQFITALVLGSWLAFNQQIITGRAIWYHHFVQYTIPIAFVVVLTTTFFVWKPSFPRLWKGMISAVIIICLWIGVLSASSYVYRIEDFRKLQHYAEVFTFLNTRAPKDCVVLIKEYDEQFERLIPAYTHCNVYSTTSAFFGITPERITHNFFLRMRLNGVDGADAHDYLLENNYEVRTYFFANWDQQFGKGLDPWLFNLIKVLDLEYKEFVKGNLKDQIQQYRMDYLTSSAPISKELLGTLPGLELATTSSGYYLYSFVSSTRR